MQLAETKIQDRVSQNHGVKIGDWYLDAYEINYGIITPTRIIGVNGDDLIVAGYQSGILVTRKITPKYGTIIKDVDHFYDDDIPDKKLGDLNKLRNLEVLLENIKTLEEQTKKDHEDRARSNPNRTLNAELEKLYHNSNKH